MPLDMRVDEEGGDTCRERPHPCIESFKGTWRVLVTRTKATDLAQGEQNVNLAKANAQKLNVTYQ